MTRTKAATQASARALPTQGIEASATTAVEQIEREFGAVFEQLKVAEQQPAGWPDLARSEPFKRLLHRLRYHVMGAEIRGGPAMHAQVLDAVCARSGLTRPELQQLAVATEDQLASGEWMPLSATQARMADDSISKPSDDRITRFGDELCKRHLPEMLKVPLKGALKAPWRVMDKAVLPAVDALGRPVEVSLETVSKLLDSAGDKLRGEVQLKLKEMKRSLRALHTSPKQLEAYSEPERRMIMMTASVLSQAAEDCDVWMDLLRDPSQARGEAVTKVAARTSLEAFAAIFHTLASTVDTLTDQDAWRLFSFRLEGTIGVEYFSAVTKYGFAATFPSITEVEGAEQPTVKIESAFTPLKTYLAYGEGTGRGFKYTVGSVGSVREAAFSRAVNFKTPTGGLAFQTDEAQGPGIELGGSLPIGIPGVFTLLPGGEVAIFHPGFAAWNEPVDWMANKLGNGTEILLDWISACARSGMQQLRGQPAQAGAQIGKGDGLARLGRSKRAVLQATVAFSTVRAYRELLAQRLEAGGPLVAPGEPAHDELLKGFTHEQASEVIGGFLEEIDERLVAALQETRRHVDAEARTPFEERGERQAVRRSAKELRQAERTFEMANVLLSQVFEGASVVPAGPFVELLADKTPGPEQLAEAVASRVDLAMSYGAFDWIITHAEVSDSLELLGRLEPETRSFALGLLSGRTVERLLAHLPEQPREGHAEVVEQLRVRASRDR